MVNKTGNIDKLKAQSVSSSSKSIFLASLFLFIFLLSFVSAQPPFQQSEQTVGLNLETPIIETHKAERNFDFHVHAHNSSNGLIVRNDTTSCIIHVYKPDGSHLIEDEMGFCLDNNHDFEYEALGGNFTDIGQYAVLLYCNSSGEGGYFEYAFDVTPGGFTQPLGFYIVFLLIALAIIVIGFAIQDGWTVVLGSILMILFGLFILLFGIDGMKDTAYTYAIGIVTIMVGSYLGIRAALDQV